MAYTKNVWVKGDVITAEKLNNMESGIGGRIIEISSIPTTIDANLTVEDFMNAYMVIPNMGWFMCVGAQLNNGYISLFSGQGQIYYIPSTGSLTPTQPE